jgi:alanyl-tRNA synthetase
MMGTNALRAQFLDFFAERGHRVVASSPLVPGNDPSLLFTNAGMVPFKDVFLGREKRDYSRAVSAQRCVRAGGKHNDLENVGYTARHHTFFEMLGNFSFGDYFKHEAIEYAWSFLTETLKLPPERFWVTVFEDDDESADIWLKKIGFDERRFSRIGARDNFWSMGDTGPCGPCSEIFYDHGPEVPGGPPGTSEEDGTRFVEIWNLVFMQYNRTAEGVLEDLPRPSVDTGMGLERLAAVIQGTHDNYEIDLFQNLIRAAADLVSGPQSPVSSPRPSTPSLKVIADHIRAVAFLIVDGVQPANEGRGYVLRRIVRRAVRHGHKLGARGPFFHKLVAPLVEEMGEAYPELRDAADHAERVIKQEELRFAETLAQGMRLLEDAFADLGGDTLPGEVVFKLYDTYGFPADLTADVARERGLKVDQEGFQHEMAAQRERARAASRFDVDYTDELPLQGETRFTGYAATADEGRIAGLLRDGEPVERLSEGEAGVVVLNVTPFYAEAGGQVGDTGVLVAEGGRFTVEDTRKADGQHLHIGRVESGEIGDGERVEAHVDALRRIAIELNHTGTHLVHAALREILGKHVRQKGSLVAPDRLRFDFAHYETVPPDLLAEIERRVNEQIRADTEGEFYYRPYDDAIAEGALAFFGEKYGDIVRVVRFGDWSVELCGGTHVARSGEIGLFKLTEERGVAAGVRRIEAVTGETALTGVQAGQARMNRFAERLKAAPVEIEAKLDKLIERNAALEKQLAQLGRKMASAQGSDLASRATQVAGVPVLAECLEGADRKTLRDTVDQLKNKLGSGVVVLGAKEDGKVALIAGVTKDLTQRLSAGDLVNFVAEQVGGRGGGRPDMAQAGGSEPDKLDDALAGVPGWVADALGGAADTAASQT